MAPLYSAVNGVQKELSLCNAYVDGTGKILTSLRTQVNSVEKEIFGYDILDHIQSIELRIEGTGNYWRTFDKSTGTVVYGPLNYTEKLSDYSGKCTYEMSPGAFTLHALSGYYVAMGGRFYLHMDDGSTQLMNELADYSTNLSIQGTCARGSGAGESGATYPTFAGSIQAGLSAAGYGSLQIGPINTGGFVKPNDPNRCDIRLISGNYRVTSVYTQLYGLIVTYRSRQFTPTITMGLT